MTQHTKNINKSSARREHFERGGTPAMWRGSAKTFTDKRKQNSKERCRDRVINED
jgi:hypothetical protein